LFLLSDMTELALDRRGSPLDASRFPARARWTLRLLERCEQGRLDISFPDGQSASFGAQTPGADTIGRPADIRLANWNVIGAALESGDIGFAETYIAGDWTSSDPARLLAFFIRNRSAVEQVIYGSYWGRLAYRIRHLLNRNTRAQSRKNIHAHYDLGNRFYELWLDPTMTYSSALLAPGADPHAPVDSEEFIGAQQAKYERVLAELALPAHAQVLELGCGWGGFAEAAARAGHRIKGLTLSTEQLAFARERLKQQGQTANLVLQDYRDEQAQYDGVASIEMFEAVGEAYWDTFFSTLARTLKPGARACVQTITIADELFERYRTSTDFIQQYIFPGGMLPSPSAFRARARAAGLVVVNELAFGPDYARTLATWRSSFNARRKEVRALGFDDRFVRIWEFYLAYCEAAFALGNTGVFQFTLVRR
jgi:cyclopropane-fatty-acyl-phospholipid synthase